MSNVAPLFKTIACVLAAAGDQDTAGFGLPDYGVLGVATQVENQLVDDALAEKVRDKPTVH